jgi:hypothetical protein
MITYVTHSRCLEGLGREGGGLGREGGGGLGREGEGRGDGEGGGVRRRMRVWIEFKR